MPHFLSLFVIFAVMVHFWRIWAYCEEMALKCEKITPTPGVSIHNWSFKIGLTTIFKYLLLKTVRQNSLVCLFLRPENGRTSEFCRMVLNSRYWIKLVKVCSNNRLWIETLCIRTFFVKFLTILSRYPNKSKNYPIPS